MVVEIQRDDKLLHVDRVKNGFVLTIRRRSTSFFKLIASAENQGVARIAQNYVVPVFEIVRITLARVWATPPGDSILSLSCTGDPARLFTRSKAFALYRRFIEASIPA